MTPFEKMKIYRRAVRWVLEMLDFEASAHYSEEVREFVREFISKYEGI